MPQQQQPPVRPTGDTGSLTPRLADAGDAPHAAGDLGRLSDLRAVNTRVRCDHTGSHSMPHTRVDTTAQLYPQASIRGRCPTRPPGVGSDCSQRVSFKPG